MLYFYNSKKTHYVYPEKHERDLKNKESATDKKINTKTRLIEF